MEEEEVKVEENTEEKEEAEAKIEEEEKTMQILMEGATTEIRTKAKVVANKEDNIKHMDKGMLNSKSNVIIVRSMVIMPMNIGRNKVTWVIDPMLILLKKISIKRSCF